MPCSGCSATHEVNPPLPFFENRKCPYFGKKGSDSVHLWVKFSIDNAVLRVSKRKTPKCFPVGFIFLVFLTKCLSKCTSSTNPTLP